MTQEKEERHPLFDREEIAYGFIASTSATFTERFIGECLAEIFMAMQAYEDYIDTLK